MVEIYTEGKIALAVMYLLGLEDEADKLKRLGYGNEELVRVEFSPADIPKCNCGNNLDPTMEYFNGEGIECCESCYKEYNR